MTDGAKKFAFYGRCSTEDHQDPESSKAWQKALATALLEQHGAQIVEDFFDIGQSRSLPWRRRTQAGLLLDAIKGGDHPFDGIVIGESSRAFFGSQFADTFPTLSHYGVELWLPELNGPVREGDTTQEILMTITGAMSKNERRAMQIRVSQSQKALVKDGLRPFMGGRPPYGYDLLELGPHPHPDKAALGKKLVRLTPNPVTSVVIERIFSEYRLGRSVRGIAQLLTDEGIPCPSATDPGRNSHRSGLAWSHGAVRSILLNPVYRGYTVTGRTTKTEVLIDPENPSLGTTQVRKPVPPELWTYSPERTHEPLIDDAAWEACRGVIGSRV